MWVWAGLSVWCCRVWVICIYECVECVPVAVLSVVIFLYVDVGGAVGVVLSCVGVVWWLLRFFTEKFLYIKPA